MKYDVYRGDTYVGKAKTLGTRKGKLRLVNLFGTIATNGLIDREDDVEYDIDWDLIDRTRGSWKLRRTM